ncbi:MAG: diphthine--ammonia ligase [Nanoarchaeota archaeon]
MATKQKTSGKIRAGVLFSGGKDSCYSAYLAKQKGYELACLISIFSDNQESYMFHTPSITRVEKQAEVMGIPIIIERTKGKKEDELKDLERAMKKAKTKYKIDTIITGAIKSEYQASRIRKICEKLKLNCLNPLWERDEIEYLNELIRKDFKVIITGVFAFPLDQTWIGREIDEKFIESVVDLNNRYKIHPAGEGGEFETFVLYCPLFKKHLNLKKLKVSGEKNSWRADIEVE